MWELDYKESWVQKNWCFWTVVLEKTLESPLDCKEIQPVHPKGDQSWIFIWRTDAKAETPILWPPDVENWLIGKDPDAWKDWRQEEKGMTKDRMVGWHHWLNESRSWWWTGRSGVLQSMGSQRVRHDWATEVNWTLPSFLILLVQHYSLVSGLVNEKRAWSSHLDRKLKGEHCPRPQTVTVMVTSWEQMLWEKPGWKIRDLLIRAYKSILRHQSGTWECSIRVEGLMSCIGQWRFKQF